MLGRRDQKRAATSLKADVREIGKTGLDLRIPARKRTLDAAYPVEIEAKALRTEPYGD